MINLTTLVYLNDIIHFTESLVKNKDTSKGKHAVV